MRHADGEITREHLEALHHLARSQREDNRRLIEESRRLRAQSIEQRRRLREEQDRLRERNGLPWA